MTGPLAVAFDWLSARLDTLVFSAHGWKMYAVPLIILLATVLLELAARRNVRVRYGSRNFRVDVIYYIFYYGGFYHLLVFAWLYRAMEGVVVAYAPWLKMNLLGGMHPALQIAAVILVADLVGYWSHRLRHAVPTLWHFHAIHHSQTTLTVATNYRFHIVDETMLRLCLFIPFQMLGTSVEIWIALDFAMAWVLLLQHSEWNWTYGRAGWLLVSPAFHRKHHAVDASMVDKNFGMLFTVWDDLFGTADRRALHPTSHGLPGNPVPETLWGQLVYPFAKIARGLRRAPAALPDIAAPRAEP